MGRFDGMGVSEGEIKRIQAKAAIMAEQNLAEREEKKRLRAADDERKERDRLFTDSQTHHKREVSQSSRSKYQRTVH